MDAVWSPDGRRVAYRWYERRKVPPNSPAVVPLPVGPGQVAVCDADGGNPKVLMKMDGIADTGLARHLSWHRDQPVLVGWSPTPPPVKAAKP